MLRNRPRCSPCGGLHRPHTPAKAVAGPHPRGALPQLGKGAAQPPIGIGIGIGKYAPECAALGNKRRKGQKGRARYGTHETNRTHETSCANTTSQPHSRIDLCHLLHFSILEEHFEPHSTSHTRNRGDSRTSTTTKTSRTRDKGTSCTPASVKASQEARSVCLGRNEPRFPLASSR